MTKAEWTQAIVGIVATAALTAVGTTFMMNREIAALLERTNDLKSRIERIEDGFLKFANLGPDQKVIVSRDADGQLSVETYRYTVNREMIGSDGESRGKPAVQERPPAPLRAPR